MALKGVAGGKQGGKATQKYNEKPSQRTKNDQNSSKDQGKLAGGKK